MGGKFSRQWKIQQIAYKSKKRLMDPAEYARKLRNKKRKEDKNKSKDRNKGMRKSNNNKIEVFHFILSINSAIHNENIDRYIHRR